MRKTENLERKTDRKIFQTIGEERLHPILTLVVYYGEEAWDGPRSLHEMMVPVPDTLKSLVADYSLNLIEVRDSDNLVFTNEDVANVFALVRGIYRKKINTDEFKCVRRDLLETVGTIVGSERIVRLARDGGREETIDMCKALEEMFQEHEEMGIEKGRVQGIEQGEVIKLRSLIKKKLEKGKSEAEIADDLEEEVDVIRAMIAALSQE